MRHVTRSIARVEMSGDPGGMAAASNDANTPGDRRVARCGDR